MRAGILGIGTALPSNLVTNEDWVARLDTTDEWIVRRTGIHTRYWLDEGAPIAPLAIEASQRALTDAGREAAELDHVIVSTITPDMITPGLGPMVADGIGAVSASASDINAACSGFLYALEQAAALIESGRSKLVLICAAEALSRLTDQEDRGTAVLFGDASAAVVVGPGDFEIGIDGFELGTDGSKAPVLYANHEEHYLRMGGQEVYRHAVATMAGSAKTLLARRGLTAADLDLFVAHQANARIVEAVGHSLGLAPEKLVMNMGRVANTSSCSIPLALAEAEQDGRLVPGMLVGLAAFGAGFVWGAGLISWKEGSLERT
jgi:3-oxoacyl-[acyl-carrier-protein] synthase-3